MLGWGIMVALVYTILCVMAVIGALMQELKVGWPRMGRKVEMALFLAGMVVAGSVQQVIVFAYGLIAGERRRQKLAHYFMRMTYSTFGQAMWGTYTIEGAENLPKGDEGVIYVANHQSSVDFSLVFTLPNNPHIVAVAKKPLLVMPGFGAMVYLHGGIFVSRGKKGTMASLIEQGTQRLADGMSIGIFPQGTRSVPSKNGTTKAWKKGAFILAQHAKAKIVPLSAVYPPDFMEPGFRGESITIKVHKPVLPKEGEDVEKLMERVEKIVMGPVLDRLKAS